MKNDHGDSRAAARLLDPRFEYRPAAETDIAATWRRFGFDPQANEQRRRLVLAAFATPPSGSLAPTTCVVSSE
jgi:hypothetical protein